MSAGLQVEVAWRLRRAPQGLRDLRRAALAALAAEGFRAGSLSVAVVGKRSMARLHADTLGITGATDVLTFDLGCERRRGRVDGEVVVCRDVAARAARGSSTRAVTRELALYVVHGVLHLAGYDDQTAAGFARMHAREDAIFTQLGWGPQFARR